MKNVIKIIQESIEPFDDDGCLALFFDFIIADYFGFLSSSGDQTQETMKSFVKAIFLVAKATGFSGDSIVELFIRSGDYSDFIAQCRKEVKI